jgi:hypothetical protein
VEVCKLEQLIDVDSLIIPNGESTTKTAMARSDDSKLGSGPVGSRSGLGIFFKKMIFGAG